MRMSDLQNKDVIDVDSGKKVGTIIDIIIDEVNGRILSLIIEPLKSFKKIFAVTGEVEIKWEYIKKIGEDVILIKRI